MSSTATEEKNLKSAVHEFLEDPRTPAGITVQFMIFGLIILSVLIPGVEHFRPEYAARHERLLKAAEWIVLAVFTIEYLLRLFTAPKGGKLHFVTRPLNIIDFMAIFPNYLEMALLATGVINVMHSTTALRVLRLLRLMRFLRVLRLFRAFNIGVLFFRKVLRYQNTVLQAILPVIAIFMGMKLIVYYLEGRNYWFATANLGELFALIGFALGIILSQKIQMAYSKFQITEETVVAMAGTLDTIAHLMNAKEKGRGDICVKWAKEFRRIMDDLDIRPNEKNIDLMRRAYSTDADCLSSLNDQMLDAVMETEPMPADLTNMYLDVMKSSRFCLNKKTRYTPMPYDTLLQQATCVYLLMMVLFMPGWPGIVSVLIATYVLYGMYYLTQDFDSITGGMYGLINIDFTALDHFIINSDINGKCIAE